MTTRPSPRQFVHEEAPYGGDGASSISGEAVVTICGFATTTQMKTPDQVRAEVSATTNRGMPRVACDF